MDPAVGDQDLVRRADRNAVRLSELLGDEFLEAWQTCGLDVVAAVVVNRLPHRLLDGIRRVEADVPLIEAERILDAVHHVADADDARQRNGVDVLGH